MKNSFFKIMAFTGLLSLFGCKVSDDPSKWTGRQLEKWFEKGEWLNGWNVNPDASVNRREFAISYFKHRDRWDKAFTFLKESDLPNMELKRYDIDGDNVYAPLSEYISKNEADADARYEAHKKYIDIQFVVNGRELIGIASSSQLVEVLEPYNEQKDIMFMTVNQITNHQAIPDRFFIFFPDDLHRPGLRDGASSLVRKAVVKVKID